MSRFSVFCLSLFSSSLIFASLVPNPGADGKVGAKAPDGWSVFSTEGKYEHKVVGDVFHSAPTAARLQGFSGTGRACFSLRRRKFMAPAPGYRLSFWFRTSRAFSPHGFVRLNDAEKNLINGWYMENFRYQGKPGVWTKFERHFSAPQTKAAEHPKTTLELNIYGDPGGIVWLDDVRLEAAAAAPPKPVPPPNPLTSEIKELPAFPVETPLVKDGKALAVIVCGNDKESAAAAQVVQQAVQKRSGVTLAIQVGGEPKDLLSKQHVIAVGNLVTNSFVTRLYQNFYTFCDRWYPGEGGHVLRSIRNPYGYGKNVILLGGSDGAGCKSAAAALVAKLGADKNPTLGWLLEVKLGKGMTPPAPGEKIRAWSEFPRKNGYFGWNPISRDFALYFMTGDTAYLDDVRLMIFPQGEKTDPRLFSGDRMFEDLRRPLRQAYHYQSHITSLIWDLIDETPALSKKEKLYIINELRLQQKIQSTGTADRFAKGETLPDRHAAHEMLCLYTGSRYFAQSYPDKVWEERLALCAKAFATSLKVAGSATPRIQTGTPHWPIQGYALYSGNDAYLKPGGTLEKRLNKWLFVGDEIVPKMWNQTMLRSAAFFLNDGAFLKIPGELPKNFHVGQSYLSDVEVKDLGATCGLRAFPLSRQRWNNVYMTAPPETAVEFVIGRSSMDLAKRQFFMLYGYYEGNKAPARVNSVIAYWQDGGRILRNNSKNALTVLRGGRLQHGPNHGIALEVCEDFGEFGYVRSRVADHNFCNWERSLFVFRNRALFVVDRAKMTADGEFEIIMPWQLARQASPDPYGGRWRQGETETAVLGIDGFPEFVGSDLRFIQRGSRTVGEQLSFRSLLTSTPAKQAAQVAPLGANAAAISANGYALAGVGGLDSQDLSIKGEAFSLGEEHWVLINATHADLFGLTISADSPISFSLDLRDGTVVARSSRAATLSLGGLATLSLSCEAGADVRARLKLPEGLAKRLVAVVQAALKTAKPTLPPKAAPLPEDLGICWKGKLADTPSAMLPLAGGSTLLADHSGLVQQLDAGGKCQWQFRAQAAVFVLQRAVLAGKPVFLVGSDDEYLYCLETDGTLRWKYKAKVSAWMAHHHAYWTMGNRAKVRSILVADAEGDGHPDIFIGTGGSALERLDEMGKPLWLYTFKYGTPNSLLLTDILPGRPGSELLVGAFHVAYDSVCRVLDAKTGKELKSWNSRTPPGQPTPRQHMPDSFAQGNASFHALLRKNGRLAVLRNLGGRSWNQLCLNDVQTGACIWNHEFGPGGRHAKLQQYATEPVVVEVDGDGVPDVVVGLRNGWVRAVSGENGEDLWSCRMERPVHALAGKADGSAFLVGLADGTLVQLDGKGVPVRRRCLAPRAQFLFAPSTDNADWIVADVQGNVRGLRQGAEDVAWSHVAVKPPILLAASGSSQTPPVPLTFIQTDSRGFLFAAPTTAPRWRIPLANAEILDQNRVLVRHDGTSSTLNIPEQPAHELSLDKGILQVDYPQPSPLVVFLGSGNLGAYEGLVPPPQGRWQSTRTDGSEFVTYKGEMLYYKPKKPGQWCEFDIRVENGGAGEIWGEFYVSPNRGFCDILIDGKPIAENLDLYNQELICWDIPRRVAPITLASGKHTVRLVLRGKRPEAKGYVLSLRSLVFVPQHLLKPMAVASESLPDKSLKVSWNEGKQEITALFSATGKHLRYGNFASDARALLLRQEGTSLTTAILSGGRELKEGEKSLFRLEQAGDVRYRPPKRN